MPDLLKQPRFQFKGDKILLILVFLLSTLSVLVVYSTDGGRVLNHIFHLLVCYGIMAFVYLIDYRLVGVLSPVLFMGALVLLGFTLFSQAVRGVTIMGHDVQTFYLIGFMVIIYISNFIARRYKDGNELTTHEVVHVFGVMCIFALGMAALNMSTAIIFFITCLMMFFVANFKTKQLLFVSGLAALAVTCVALVVLVSMKSDQDLHIGRMTTFVNRIEYYLTKDNSQNYGDQMVLSRAAIARGGFHPAGPGKGVIKNRLPENSTDYAFASLYEEIGIAAGILIIMIYLIFFYRAREISKNAGGPFGKLLAFGIGFWLTSQALVHIGVNCDLLPATGQTLPLISSGGASLIVSGSAIGLLLNISKLDAKQIAKTTEKPRFVRGDH
ncbi:MAG: FtsW/RodA/SpoVE family cell cycle protein [Bacteroidales bacterium]|nr:FtsW/RodA/SpoVE family cell cycle protein [Bacteroidales bacterium]